MQTCPHCGAAGVAARAKVRSSAGWPSACSLCDGLSYVEDPAVVRWGIPVLGELLAIPYLFLLLLAPVATLSVSVVALLTVLLVSDRWRARARLRPTDATHSRRSRRWTYLLLAVFGLLMVGGGVMAHREQDRPKEPTSPEALRRLKEFLRRPPASRPTSARPNPALQPTPPGRRHWSRPSRPPAARSRA